MKISMPKSFYAGLLLYATIFALAAVPLFPSPLAPDALVRLAIAAGIASSVVGILLLTGLDSWLRDPGACFTQAMLGIAICTGLYTVVGGGVPDVMDVAVLWVAVGISRLSLLRTLLLLTSYFAFYTYATYPAMADVANPAHSEAAYALGLSLAMAAMLCWRAYEYERIAREKAQQATQLEEATEHVRTLTTYDPDTTALKQSYFVAQVLREKARVEHEGGTFSMGLIEVDNFDELSRTLGPTVAKQLLREFSERAAKNIRQVDTLGAWPRTFQPLGRLTDGRFGLLLPSANYDAAMKCAQRLHNSVEFQSIRTAAGIVGITLSIGVTEYGRRETLEELMQLAERALNQAKAHNGNDFRGLRRAAAA